MKSWNQDLFLGLSDSESELLYTMFPGTAQKLVMIPQITGPIIWIQIERQISCKEQSEKTKGKNQLDAGKQHASRITNGHG